MRLSWLAVIACLAIGCARETTGARIDRSGNYFPETFSGPVTLTLANVEVPAEAVLTNHGSAYALAIQRNGVTLEEEVYDVDTKGISAVQLGTGERLDPPLPLLELPMRIGEEFGWTGDVIVGSTKIPAEATISTERSRPDLPTGPVEAVHVVVILRMMDGTPKEALRRLDFWFADGLGPIKRDYGNQVREPRVPSTLGE